MARYKNIQIKDDKYSQNRYYVNVVYPEIPPTIGDVYMITKLGDRTDRLAHNYYGDRYLWWIINRANPDKVKRWSYFLEIGTQIRIPSNVEKILYDFDKINKVR